MNNLSGVISAAISNCSRLTRLDLSNNSFTGSIPESFGNLEYLTLLDLQENSFFSDSALNFLTSLINFRKLIELNFSKNMLDGVFPTSVANFFESLQICEGQDCKLKGIIPEEIGDLTGVANMSMLNLQELYLQGNKIKGTISDAICNLKNHGALDSSENRFSGSVPSCIEFKIICKFVEPSKSHRIQFTSNLSSGIIPLEIGNLKAVSLIDLSKNDFSGKIPITIGGLDKLIKFSLAQNRLDGPTPDSFSKMLSLEFLDLCYNNISSSIPKSLEALVYLKYLNISCNNLSGEIPTGGSFANVTNQSFMSNDALCVDSKFQVPPCFIKSPKRSKRKKAILATTGFDESNLLGYGSFSVVYKGKLKDGTLIAAKIFNTQLDGALKSSDTECEALRNLRRLNLTKVITSCSNLHFKALRLDIMIDVAYALDYLHSSFSTPVVHCDLMPHNVLLDQEMVGHVSDFGIANLLGAFVQTGTIGTIGYIAPEYGQDRRVSMSCEVYSFGILMMKTFTIMRPSDEIFIGDLSIRCWISDSFPSEIHKVVDANLVQPGEEQIGLNKDAVFVIYHGISFELHLSDT
ncbi:receptor kinase-like protein Xa21 [Lycium barbarum]|uniref:receptor kinase-like protein Xa21 n=1 Tax=Lycium barbarum TaxID=112863 RepID=UPI00293E03EE|nr:receptor kinase-like protein Xa21 [Lycium barbarum]